MGRRLEGLRQFLSHPFFADLRDFAEGHDTIDPGNRLQRWVAVRLNWQSRCVFASRRCGYELVILCGVFWGWVGCVRCRSNLSRNRAAKEGGERGPRWQSAWTRSEPPPTSGNIRKRPSCRPHRLAPFVVRPCASASQSVAGTPAANFGVARITRDARHPADPLAVALHLSPHCSCTSALAALRAPEAPHNASEQRIPSRKPRECLRLSLAAVPTLGRESEDVLPKVIGETNDGQRRARRHHL